MENRLEKINFLGRYLSSFRSVDEALEMAMIISQDVLGYDHAMIRLLENDTLKAVKWIGFPREATDLVISVGEGISGEVAQTGRAILVTDTLKDSRFLMGVEGCRSELCVPMTYDGKTVGIINVESEQQGFFTETDRHILETFASQLSASFESARLREELGMAEKMSVVGSFASSILHDIRNDIHLLNISSDLLKKGSTDRERIERVSKIVKKSADNIYGLIEDVFEFVKTGKSSLSKKSVNLDQLLLSVTQQLKEQSPDNIEFKINITDSTDLEMDERRMRRVLLNLGKNGVEAMPDGGMLEFNVRREADIVDIKISDTGVGIPKDNIERIWEPLFSYGKKQGTGLGMAIVKQIVNDHGWEVSVESEQGKGSTFTIKAPCPQPESET
jgi:signal transduction histidine kinase